MIPCTDFIPAYSELFKFLEQHGGKRSVEDFWNYLSDRFLGNLRQAVVENGFARLLELLAAHAQRRSGRVFHGIG
jgi:hypothetical protein